jgi:hypothetical protein
MNIMMPRPFLQLTDYLLRIAFSSSKAIHERQRPESICLPPSSGYTLFETSDCLGVHLFLRVAQADAKSPSIL